MKENLLSYKSLKKQKIDLVELLSQEESFSQVPEDWCVFVVDIENSTQVVQKGMHEEVNLAATGSIVSVLNEIKNVNKKIRIPYFFGGDGATFIIPGQFQEKVFALLENYRYHIQLTMALVLRVGCVNVNEIYKLNHRISIAKFALTRYLTVPIVLGAGLKYAEHTIKSSFVDTQKESQQVSPVNLIGMECRWKEIKPEVDEKKIICLIADCTTENKQAQVYKSVIEKMNSTFGRHDERNPVSNSQLKLELSMKKIKEELKVKYRSYSFINSSCSF